jgi:hypothetical protein
MAWEYKLVHLVGDTVDEKDYEEHLCDSFQYLNELGSEWWELVGFLPHRSTAQSRRHHAILKRPKN